MRKLTEEEKMLVQFEIKEINVISLEAITQRGNWYIYCINNPLYYIDPTGNFTVRTNLFGVFISFTEHETQILIKTATLGEAGISFYTALSGIISGQLVGILLAGVVLQAAYYDWMDTMGGNRGLTFFVPWYNVGGVYAYPNS